MKKVVKNEVELKDLAKELVEIIKEKNINLISFYAELGAGKTTFSKYLAKELGVKENIISPTFVILKEYETQDTKIKKLVHIDAYRLSGEEDAKVFKLDDYLKEGNLVLLEWAENFKNLPQKRLDIKIKILKDGGREFDIMQA